MARGYDEGRLPVAPAPMGLLVSSRNPSSFATPQWAVVEYEVKMYLATHGVIFNPHLFDRLPRALKNAATECAVLHTRILCDVFLSRGKEPDDICLDRLLPGWETDSKYAATRAAVAALKAKYGGRNAAGTPCWVFNKMAAHPTTNRGDRYDYDVALNAVRSEIHQVIGELERLYNERFERNFVRA